MLGDAEARASALRRRARPAERYRQLSAGIRLAEARLVFVRWREAAQAAEAAGREAKVAGAEVADADVAQRAAGGEAHAAAQALADARRQVQAARDAAAAAIALAALRGERASLDRRVGELARQTAALEADRIRDSEPDAPPVRRDDGGAGREPAGNGRSRRRCWRRSSRGAKSPPRA